MAIAFQINAFQSIDQQLEAVGGIQSAEAFGTAAVGPYVPVVDVSIQSAEAVGRPSVVFLGTTKIITGVGAITSGQAFGDTQVVVLFPTSGDLGNVDVLVDIRPIVVVFPIEGALAQTTEIAGKLYETRSTAPR